MTISIRTELSHNYSFDSSIDCIFKLTLVAESRAEAKGFHHIIMIDTSTSMAGQKIELAKRGAEEYAKRIPPGNRVSIVTFSDTVHTYPETDLGKVLPTIKAAGLTALYSALQSTFEIAKKTSGPGWILLLTDGEPTDVMKPELYSQLKVPSGYKMVEFGIGEDYKESILKALADASGGTLYHITDAQKLPNLMQDSAVDQVAGRNIKVEFGNQDVRVLNYKGPPVEINALETIARIWGQVRLPAGFKGDLMNIQVSYGDSIDGSRKTLKAPVSIRIAKSNEEYQQGIRSNLISEFSYYRGLEDYYNQLSAGHMKEATQTMQKLTANAEQTRRADLIESTRQLSDKHEQTLKLGDKPENTKKLLKEAASETTKRARDK